jgi:hypothetical protein
VRSAITRFIIAHKRLKRVVKVNKAEKTFRLLAKTYPTSLLARTAALQGRRARPFCDANYQTTLADLTTW